MADKTIHIDENGKPSEDPATVKPRQKVIWESTNEQEFTVKFPNKLPFGELKWRFNNQETGKKVDGKVKSHGAGTFHYPYDVTMHQSLLNPGPTSGPELIVDGGRSKKKKKPAPRKKAVKAKSAKRAGAKKSARSAGRKKSAKKAVKSGARKKR